MRRNRYIYAAILAITLCVCTTVAGAESRALWLDVPFIKQSPEGCGAASIAMVLQYWSGGQAAGDGADAAHILRTLHSSSAHGIYASAMSRYLQQQGFETFSFAGDWDLLEQHLAKGRPLIVALKPATLERTLHYVVVAGIDPQRQIVMVNDPAERKLRELDRASFEKQWEGVQRWTLLALPKQPGN